MAILDQYGKPIAPGETLRREKGWRDRYLALKARYDAARDTDALVNYWANVDQLDPTTANSYQVRKKLRTRSRFEVVENNPYLKGTILTITNDFIGSGPKLQITDKRLPKPFRQHIEKLWIRWAAAIKYRQILWRMKLAKCVDGEGPKRAFIDRRLPTPVKLNWEVFETDRITSQDVSSNPSENEIDGVRFDQYQRPTQYYILDNHPGSLSWGRSLMSGQWIKAKWVTVWFRKDRSWLRGIPETTPSLSLCAMLRRYTLAVVKSAEVAADFSAILESEMPPSATPWTDGAGNVQSDDPFDVFPIEHGMFTTLPWGYKMRQLEAQFPGTMYDKFVEALLREITRPLLVPFNVASGTSKDSNMASAVVDTHIYKEGITADRHHCEEEVLGPDLALWWEFTLAADARDHHLTDVTRGANGVLLENPDLRLAPPDHVWRWDRVGLDHTDPVKVANSLKILHDKKFITDRDIQESRYNRDVEDWREDLRDQETFREEIAPQPIPEA